MIKKFLPKTLFFRYFLIIITPVILLQVTLTIVFFDSLWLKTNKGLVNSLSDESKLSSDGSNKKVINNETTRPKVIIKQKSIIGGPSPRYDRISHLFNTRIPLNAMHPCSIHLCTKPI